VSFETRRVGELEVTAILDADFPDESMSDSFPGVTAEELAAAATTYAGLVTSDGRWRLRVRSWLVRHGDGILLLDTGIGGVTSPTQAWAPQTGALRAALEEMGVALADIGTVAISHVHDDHIGGLLDDDGSPLCPNARFVLQRADHGWLRSVVEQDAEMAPVWALLAALESHDVLDLIEGDRRLGPALQLRHAPGHTPGHQVLVVEAGGQRMVLSADTWNHPLQLANPDRPSGPDTDHAASAAARRTLLDDVLAHPGTVVAPTHFAEAFGEIRGLGTDVTWVPARQTDA
jgi:glyoxylase-like metal-dependent hydrolase (beta-lactamase superfamily II)